MTNINLIIGVTSKVMYRSRKKKLGHEVFFFSYLVPATGLVKWSTMETGLAKVVGWYPV
jgi:hypothetical protein